MPKQRQEAVFLFKPPEHLTSLYKLEILTERFKPNQLLHFISIITSIEVEACITYHHA